MQMAPKATANIQCDKCVDKMQPRLGWRHGWRAQGQSWEWWRRFLENQAWVESFRASEYKPGRERWVCKATERVSLWTCMRLSLTYIPRSGISGSLISPSMTLPNNYNVVPTLCVRVSIFPHLYYKLIFSNFLMFAGQMVYKMEPTWMCISVHSWWFAHVFRNLLAIWVYLWIAYS